VNLLFELNLKKMYFLSCHTYFALNTLNNFHGTTQILNFSGFHASDLRDARRSFGPTDESCGRIRPFIRWMRRRASICRRQDVEPKDTSAEYPSWGRRSEASDRWQSVT